MNLVHFILPEILILFAAILILLFKTKHSAVPDIEYEPFKVSNIFAAGLIFLVFSWIYLEKLPLFYNYYNYKNHIVFDKYVLHIKSLLIVATIFLWIGSRKFNILNKLNKREYFFAQLLALLGAGFFIASKNLIYIYLSLELMSISLYFLCAIDKKNILSQESGLKYLLLGSFASIWTLIGIAIIFLLTNSFNLYDIYIQLAYVNTSLASIGIFLFITGFLFKIGVVPFHLWLADVYEGAPTSVTAFITIVPKYAVLGFLLFLFVTLPSDIKINFKKIIYYLAILTMSVGNLCALTQNNIKRMLAFSSIAHIGYLLTALLISNTQIYSIVIFYFWVYLFMNTGAFIVLMILEKNKQAQDIKLFKGLHFKNGFLAFAMLIFCLALTGLPPTAGFTAKFKLFKILIDNNYIILAMIAVINSVISAFYYLKIPVYMYMHNQEKSQAAEPEEKPSISFFNFLLLLFFIISLLIKAIVF